MFTGIVEEVGKVNKVSKQGKSISLVIGCSRVLEDSQVGDSIAVNGVCLTVTHKGPTFFMADIMPETYDLTCLNYLKVNDLVHLERAISLNSRLGGHLVSGHVDTRARLKRFRVMDGAKHLTFGLQEGQEVKALKKGSIAINGVSLTLVNVGPSTFEVAIIPHTQTTTLLGHLRVGQEVNIEWERQVFHQATPSQTSSFEATLRTSGFL